MASTNAVKEETLRPLQQRYDLQGVKVEAVDYDGTRSLAGEVPVVEISSSSSGEKSFTTADGGEEAMYPVGRPSQSKRSNPFDIVHNSNGSSLVASSPKRSRVGLNRGADIGVRVEGRNNYLQAGSFDQRQEVRTPVRTPDLPADFLEPLEPLGIVPARNSPLPLVASSFPFGNAVMSRSADRVSRQFWKAGDYESDQVRRKSLGGGMDHVRVHPKFLHSNATSHKWALGAIAELLDNALDEVVNGATYVTVDMITNPKGGEPMLLIEDDGGGMSPDSMRQCMSLGYSAKSKIANTIGQYGNGFKTSTMRLGADVIVFSRCPGRHGCGPTESIGILSYSFLRDTGQEDIVVPMIDYDIQPFGLRKLIRSNVDDWNRNMETMKKWSPYSTETELLDQFKEMKSQGTKIIVYNLWEDDQGQLELDFEANPHDIQVRGANREERNISMAERFPNSKHYLTYRHSLRSYASILYLRLPQTFRMFLRGKEVKHHNLIDDLMYTQESTYKPQGGSDQLHREAGLMKAVVTVGFVKDAKEHIDVQGFNVYHKNRLIKPFWRIWNSAASRGRGIIGVLEANFVEPAHDKQGFERTIVLARLEARLLEMQKNYWSKNCHKVGYVTTSTKDKDGKQAYRGPSSKKTERSKELPDAHSGPSELPITPTPVPALRSSRSQTPDHLHSLTPAGANPEVQVPPGPLALVRSLRSQIEDRLQLARQEVRVSSPPLVSRSSLHVMPPQEQLHSRLSQTGQGSDRGAPSILSAARSSLSQRHREPQAQAQGQSEVQLPVIPFPVPKGLRSHLHERHQARLLQAAREPAAELPLDPPPAMSSSLVQSQTQAESVPVPMDILSATTSLLSQKHNLSPEPVHIDLTVAGRSLQSDAHKEGVNGRMQGTTGVAADVSPISLFLQEAQEAFQDDLSLGISTGIEAPPAFQVGTARSPGVEAGISISIPLSCEESHRSQAEAESAAESSHISLTTNTESQSRLLNESLGSPAQAAPSYSMTVERSQGYSQKGLVSSVGHGLVAPSRQEGMINHLQEEISCLHGSLVSSARACVVPSETYEAPHFHPEKASHGLAAEVSPPLATFEGSESPLLHAMLDTAAECAPVSLVLSEPPLQANPESAAALNPLVCAESLLLQAAEERDSPAQFGNGTIIELPSANLVNGRPSRTDERPQGCLAQNRPAPGQGPSTEGPSISLDFTSSVPIEAAKECPISIPQCRPDLMAEASITDFTATLPSAETLPLQDKTGSAPAITNSKPETHSINLEKHLGTDAETSERGRDAKSFTAVAPPSKTTTYASPSKASVRFATDASVSRAAHLIPENSPPKISKNSGFQNKDLLLGRKSLEDLGRMFAKKAVATEKTRNGTDQSVTSESHSEPTKEAMVSGVEVQEGSKEIMTTYCSDSNKTQLEAQLAEMEQEVQILNQKLTMVTSERDSLRQQLEQERKQGQLVKMELQTKLEETWAQVREFEARNNCLRQAQH